MDYSWAASQGDWQLSEATMKPRSNAVQWQRPHTRLGWWSLRLAALFIVLFVINSALFIPLLGQSTANPWWQHALLPFYGIFMLLCGLAAGVSAMLAVTRQHERSWLVWLTLLPAAFVLFLLLGEFLVPH